MRVARGIVATVTPMTCPWRRQLFTDSHLQQHQDLRWQAHHASYVHRPRIALARAQSVDADESSGGPRSRQKRQSQFPGLESPDEDAGTFLPVRQPGTFPAISVRTFWDRVTLDLWEGADVKFTPKKAAGGFDPLRDGPLRYLGYSNECG